VDGIEGRDKVDTRPVDDEVDCLNDPPPIRPPDTAASTLFVKKVWKDIIMAKDNINMARRNRRIEKTFLNLKRFVHRRIIALCD
jgi:hypothetical protein